MPRERKVDPAVLADMLLKKATVDEMAQHFAVTKTAIKQWLRKLQQAEFPAAHALPTAVLSNPESVERAASATLDAVEEWFRIRREIDKVLKRVNTTSTPEDMELVLNAVRRLQKSLDQWIKMASLLHDWQAQQQFQEEVLAVVGEVAPDARAEIVRRLSERRSLRLTFSGAPGANA